MFSQEDFPANHSVLQEREREQKITATSGRTCYEQFAIYNPLGLFVKTLLESSRWYSTARRLIWVAKPLYLKRITEQERSSSTQSKEYVKVLSRRDIQSRRLLFQLVPLARHTEETGCGLLPTVQTQGLKVCNKEGKTEFLNLSLIPTPTSSDSNAGTHKESKKRNRSTELKNLFAMRAGKTSQLNPLFVAEMMGFPLDWLTLPFLSPNGEEKALKR